jgi:hypothetical protein
MVTDAVIIPLPQADWNVVPRIHLGTLFQPCQDGAHGD